MTRRQALSLLGLGGLAMMGCRSEDESSDETGTTEGDFSSKCAADRLKSAAQTSPEALRRYDHIVVLMMENRSFDHYFGHLSMPTSMGGEGRTDVDGLKGNEVQHLYGPNGEIQKSFNLFHASTRKVGDIAHGWDDCHTQFNNGGMNGFIQAQAIDMAKEDPACGHHCAELGDPMAYYKREDTPVLHELLDNYALCDRWFSSVMGPTWPNRFYLHAGTSMGIKSNDKMDTSHHPNDDDETRTIWHEMKDKCLNAVNYSMDFAFNLGGFGLFNSTPTRSVFKQARPSGGKGNPPPPPESFEEACERGTLPSVSMIDPAFIFAPCDDHPPHDIKSGQAFISSIYKLLTKNPKVWEKTLFIITYDEHGSFYDHVSPPKIDTDNFQDFNQLGFRVPSLVIGPYVKKNYVSHVQYDHTSFLSTVTRRFGLSPLNNRVAKANDVSDCIDMNALNSLKNPNPVTVQSVLLKESLVHESIKDSLGQDELAHIVLGRPATLDEKRRATDDMLAAYDRIGVATIR